MARPSINGGDRMKTILHAFDINAEPEEVRRALTTLEGLSGWWTTDVTGETDEGGVIHFTFEGDFNPDMRVDQSSGSAVRWTCIGGHEPWLDNTFHFELSGEAPVSVTMRQHYARELTDRAYGIYNFNWGYYLDSLRSLLESGTGKPFRVDEAKKAVAG
jgi:uncharacterized protein YndB with AHSA1/START domain